MTSEPGPQTPGSAATPPGVAAAPGSPGQASVQRRCRVRPPAVAGTFYPRDPQALRRAVADCVGAAIVPPDLEATEAVIAAHAGYRYSGPTAAAAYRAVAARRAELRRVVVVGPSHRHPVGGTGVGISTADAWRTPLGEVTLDTEAAARLVADGLAVEADAAHAVLRGVGGPAAVRAGAAGRRPGAAAGRRPGPGRGRGPCVRRRVGRPRDAGGGVIRPQPLPGRRDRPRPRRADGHRHPRVPRRRRGPAGRLRVPAHPGPAADRHPPGPDAPAARPHDLGAGDRRRRPRRGLRRLRLRPARAADRRRPAVVGGAGPAGDRVRAAVRRPVPAVRRRGAAAGPGARGRLRHAGAGQRAARVHRVTGGRPPPVARRGPQCPGCGLRRPSVPARHRRRGGVDAGRGVGAVPPGGDPGGGARGRRAPGPAGRRRRGPGRRHASRDVPPGGVGQASRPRDLPRPAGPQGRADGRLARRRPGVALHRG